MLKTTRAAALGVVAGLLPLALLGSECFAAGASPETAGYAEPATAMPPAGQHWRAEDMHSGFVDLARDKRRQ
jgi:hypothetical protein